MDSGWSKSERHFAGSVYDSAWPLGHFENRDDRGMEPGRLVRQVSGPGLRNAVMLTPTVFLTREGGVGFWMFRVRQKRC